MKKTLLREFSYYVFYNLITLVSITILVSLITFFHFLLDHPIETIESWLFDNGWGLIITSKLIALYMIMKVYILNKNEKPTLKRLVWKHFIGPKKEIIPILITYVALFFLLDRINLIDHPEYEVSQVIKSFFYGLIFYLSDLFLLAQVSIDKKNIKNFIYPFIFIITSKLSFLLITVSDEKGQIFSLITYFNMMLLMFLSGANRGNRFSLLAPLIFLAVYICPLISFFGLDPVWGDSQAVLTLDIVNYSKNYVILSLLILCYLYLKKIKFKEKYGVG
ncbi:MAG: hypothetical protein DRQ88_10125 [Epsilonproteobacteria bacterium]|nr:MAG: hypothetical protein DRQ89_08305 [Campylobacterota bacterium]RLA64884.1 MAG: hypothetical protein DRQ88_10125 [Campylobacterota bacterium]